MNMEDFNRSRSATRSQSMITEAPLPDVFSILNEFNQGNLDSQSQRLVTEIKNISDYQKESVQEVIEKSQAMISDIIWQREQLIGRIKEECSIRAVELKEIILSLQKSSSERRLSKILKPFHSEPLITFNREIHYSKKNWLKKSKFSVKFSLNGIEKIDNSCKVFPLIQPYYQEIEESSNQTAIIINRKLGDEGARFFSHILPYYKNLSVLTLTSNVIGPRGGRFIANSLPYLRKLTKLHINNERIKDAILSIFRVLPCLTCLEDLYLSTGVFYEREVGDIAQALSIMPRLKHFSILGGILEGKGAEKLSYGLFFLNSLKSLDLSGNCLGQSGAEVLATSLSVMTVLESLKLSANNFPSTAGEFLGKMICELPQLEEFWVNSNNLGDQGVCEMMNQGTLDLKVLKVQDNGIGNIGAKVIFQKCLEWKQVNLVDLSWNCLDQKIFAVFYGNEEKYRRVKVEICGMNLELNGFSGFAFNV